MLFSHHPLTSTADDGLPRARTSPILSAVSTASAARSRAMLARRAASTSSTSKTQTTSGAAAASTVADGAQAAKASAAAAAQRGFAYVRARPILSLSSFLLLHVTTAQLLLIPAYGLVKASGMGNAVIAGPQAAYILAKPVPDWALGAMGLDASSNPLPGGKKQRTVEDVIELMARRAAGVAWKGANMLYGGAKEAAGQVQELQSALNDVGSGKGSEGKILKKLQDMLLGGANSAEDSAPASKGQAEREAGETAEKAMRKMKGEDNDGTPKRSLAGKAWDSTLGKDAKRRASELKFGMVRDAVGAYILVKVLLPIRLPVSMYLTPKFARFMSRAFTRR